MDRPPRKTRVVNYSEAKAFDDDDDFACVKAPPSKRPREDVKREHKKSSSMSANQESNSQPAASQKSRRPLDVKVYERDLEAALTLSSLNNGGGIKDQSSTHKDVQICVPVDENTDPTSSHLSNCSVDLTALGLDEITSEKESTSISRQRKAATEEPKNRPTDEDEDYEPKLTPDSESDDDFSEPAESEDEEFTVKKVSKTKNEKTKPPPASKEEKQPSKPSKSKLQAAAASTPVRSPPTPKLAPKIPASSSSVSTSTPALPLSPMGARIPKWNPPAQVGRSPTSFGPAVKSPGQGLRLGLSRLVRVKPLHPGVSSP
ncbi:RAD51-associated protein 1 [Cyclopterus lumpus]|uniref:RAD51-associated protein 1 n=1 Tax=Cyclopterus lumpus TaxID=8103 RepID=UPI0014872860|nr:RAD51-associated protein 1 [Cyclopterus lumpus]XP_034382689.1 RAD51-associated protein 1 [Cyclopterus lumpus]